MSKNISEIFNPITLEEMEQLTKSLIEKRNQIFKLQDMIRNIVSEIKTSSKELVNKTFNGKMDTIKLDNIYIWNGHEISFKGSVINKKKGCLNKQVNRPITLENIIKCNINSYLDKNDYDIIEIANSILDKDEKTKEDLELLQWIRMYIFIDFPCIVLKEFKDEYKQCLIRMYTEENIGSVEDINILETMENIKDVDTLVLGNY